MFFSFLKKLFNYKKKYSEKPEDRFGKVIDEGLNYNKWHEDIVNGDDDYNYGNECRESKYREIYNDMKNDMGIKYNIKFKLYALFPYVSFIEKRGQEDVLSISVNMTCDSIQERYIGSLAHELWHVKTTMELIQYIGFDEYVKLQRNHNYEKSLAFKTLSEYHSWYKAISEYNEVECNITLRERLYDYRDTRIDKIDLCDTIAAHCAWNVANKTTFQDDRLPDEYKSFIERVMKIIILNSITWPISLESFDKIGKDIIQLFVIVDNKKEM